jgi:hypothetical protein
VAITSIKPPLRCNACEWGISGHIPTVARKPDSAHPQRAWHTRQVPARKTSKYSPASNGITAGRVSVTRDGRSRPHRLVYNSSFPLCEPHSVFKVVAHRCRRYRTPDGPRQRANTEIVRGTLRYYCSVLDGACRRSRLRCPKNQFPGTDFCHPGSYAGIRLAYRRCISCQAFALEKSATIVPVFRGFGSRIRPKASCQNRLAVATGERSETGRIPVERDREVLP